MVKKDATFQVGPDPWTSLQNTTRLYPSSLTLQQLSQLRPHLSPERTVESIPIASCLESLSFNLFTQSFSTCNSIFMFLICLKLFLTYGMKPGAQGYGSLPWSLSPLCPFCVFQDSQVPAVTPACLVFHAFPWVVLSARKVHLLQWVWKIPIDLQVSSQVSLPLGSPRPRPFLFISSITFIALNWNFSFIYLGWSSLRAGLVSFISHLSSLAQCLAQMSTWEI